MIVRFIKRLATDRAGSTAIEYGLIVTLIVIAMIAALSLVADSTSSMWNRVNTKVTQSAPAR